MTAVGSSKAISNREIFYLVFLLQQSGMFWLLPYFLVRGNGTLGISAIFGGLLTAIGIILVGHYRVSHIAEMEFMSALRQRHTVLGTVTGVLVCLLYLMFAILMLYSLVDVIQKQLLTETPRMVLCAVTVLLAGWLSKGGLESIARLNMLCIGALLIMMITSVVGTLDLFTIEHALPLQMKNAVQFEEALLQSMFCYSGLLVVFMLYPASREKHSLYLTLGKAVAAGMLVTILWTVYALCILGEYSLQTVLWIPVHLARMVQIGTLLEQAESLFIVLWMIIVMTIGSLFLWCTTTGTQQLIGKQKARWMLAAVLWVVFFGMMALHNTMGLLQAELILAKWMTVILPIVLLAVVWLIPNRRGEQ